MFLVGLFGLFLSGIAYFVGFRTGKASRFRLFCALFIVHIGACLIYWNYSLSGGADALSYYYDFDRDYRKPFTLGTTALVYFVQYLRKIFGGYYIEYFLLFQSFGFIGISILLRIFDEVVDDLGETLRPTTIALLFLPGLHFWSSAIGKDAPLFLSVCLSVWAAMRIERRWIAFAAAILIMFFIRPHIAGLATISLAITLIMDQRTAFWMRAALVLLACGASAIIIRNVLITFQIDSLNSTSISDFIASKQDYGSRSEEGAILTGLPFPLKIASLLFRPLFFDAKGVLGLVASLENLVILLVFGNIVANAKSLVRLSITVPYLRYCLVFSVTLIVLLSLITYNVGLGLRQKYMVMPAVFLIFMTLAAFRRATRTPDPTGTREELLLRHAGPGGPELTPPR